MLANKLYRYLSSGPLARADNFSAALFLCYKKNIKILLIREAFQGVKAVNDTTLKTYDTDISNQRIECAANIRQRHGKH